MSMHPQFRRIMLAAMLAAIVGLPLLTLGLLWPKLRHHSIKTALSASTGPSFWWPPSWRQELKVLQKLRDPVTIELFQTPFGDVTDFLRDYTGEQFSLDETRLKLAGISRDTPVTIAVQQISLGSALKLMLDDLDAKCRIDRGAIRITNREPHEKTMPNLVTPKPENPAEQKIRDALGRSMTLEFVESPFGDVISFLRSHTGVNIVLDRKRLEKQDVTTDTPVTFRVEEIPLSKALPILLDPLHLTYRVQDEVLFITAKGPSD